MSTTTAAAPQLDPALYESRAWVPIAVVAPSLTIATACVALRVYTRAVMYGFGYDDGAAVLAMVLALACGIVVAANTIYGHGRHIQVVDPSLLPKYFRMFYISIVLYNGSLSAIKLLFLLQYYRLLARAGLRNAIIITFVVIALWSISQTLVVMFECTPIQKFWLPDIPGTCIPELPFWYINSAGNIATDIAIFVLPLPALSRLKLPKIQKICLIGVFCLGFFTCAISVIRIQYLNLGTDVTWDNVGASCWSIGELSSGITCACVPTLRPLLAKVLPCLRSPPDGGSTGGGKSSAGKSSAGVVSNPSSPVHKGDPNKKGNTRGIIYPEDLTLQSYHGSAGGIRMTTAGAEGAEGAPVGQQQQQQPAADPSTYQEYGRAMDKLRLSLRPTVQTEIKAGTPGLRPSWPAMDGGIEVRTDFSMTKSPDSPV